MRDVFSADVLFPCGHRVKTTVTHSEWPGTREIPPDAETDLELPFNDDGYFVCPNCGRVCTPGETDGLVEQALEQQPEPDLGPEDEWDDIPDYPDDYDTPLFTDDQTESDDADET